MMLEAWLGKNTVLICLGMPSGPVINNFMHPCYGLATAYVFETIILYDQGLTLGLLFSFAAYFYPSFEIVVLLYLT